MGAGVALAQARRVRAVAARGEDEPEDGGASAAALPKDLEKGAGTRSVIQPARVKGGLR